MSHKVGDIVEIFENPVTQENSEGKAKLVNFQYTKKFDNTRLDVWSVTFADEIDPMQYTRAILVKHTESAGNVGDFGGCLTM